MSGKKAANSLVQVAQAKTNVGFPAVQFRRISSTFAISLPVSPAQ